MEAPYQTCEIGLVDLIENNVTEDLIQENKYNNLYLMLAFSDRPSTKDINSMVEIPRKRVRASRSFLNLQPSIN